MCSHQEVSMAVQSEDFGVEPALSALEGLILKKLKKYGGALRAERLRDLLVSHTLGTEPHRTNALRALSSKGLVTFEGLQASKIVSTTIIRLRVLVPHES